MELSKAEKQSIGRKVYFVGWIFDEYLMRCEHYMYIGSLCNYNFIWIEHIDEIGVYRLMYMFMTINSMRFEL